VKFLGVEDDTAFVEALIECGRFPDECRAYLETVRANDGAVDRVRNLLARLEARNPSPEG
jgi:hypothetical protein